MAITVSVTKDVTTLDVTDSVTQLDITEQTTTLSVQNVSITQSNSANVIAYSPSGHLEATNVQSALDELAATPEFTAALDTKLSNIEALADVTDTANVVSALTAGDNVTIGEDGTIAADVLGAISAGTGIDIDDGVISVEDIAIATVQTAADETAHLALSTQQGDVVIRTDENKSYIHNGGTAGTMADFTELATNTNGVLSINGSTGAVTFNKSDLNDYSANEFIDWTTSQTDNIHADNYITYSAGTGINIDENYQISATGGGGGGTSFTATGNLNLDDNNNLDTVASPLFQTVRFTGLNGTDDSGIFIKRFPKEDFIAGAAGDGIGVYYDDGTEENLVVALTDTGFAIASEIESAVGIKLAGHRFGYSAQEWATRASNFTTYQVNVPTEVYDMDTGVGTFVSGSGEDTRLNHNRHSIWLTATTSVYMKDQDSDTSISGKYNIVNRKYVDDTFEGLNVPQLPTVESEDIEDFQYIVAGNGTYIPRGFNTYLGCAEHASGGMHFAMVDQNTATSRFGLHLQAGSGISMVRTTDFAWTISANPDGLPDQSASTDGYVLTSVSEVAAWQPVGNVVFPPQSAATDGYVLTSNGTTASWQSNDSFPDQANNSGKFLQTLNGNVRWADVDALPTQSTDTNDVNYSAGKFLASNGDNAYWHVPSSSVPEQTNHSGKFLTTNGSSLSWQTVNTAGTTGNISFSTNTISSSSDSINIDDDLNVQGALDAERIDISGAGAPTIESLGAFNIEAPDGVFANEKRIDLDSPYCVMYINYSANLASILSHSFFGERFNGSPTSVIPTIQSSGGNKKQIVINSVGASNEFHYFVEVSNNINQFDQRENEPIRIQVQKSGAQTNIILAQGDSQDAPDQNGTIKVKWYAT
jgi:hypothetical protein